MAGARTPGRRGVGEGQFRFQTRALALEHCLLKNRGPRAVRFSLHFNHPVHPTDLLKYLAARDANSGADLHPVAVSQEAGDRIVLCADRPTSGAPQVHVRGGLAGEGGHLGLGQDVSRDLAVARRLTVLRAEAADPGLEKDVLVSLPLSPGPCS